MNEYSVINSDIPVVNDDWVLKLVSKKDTSINDKLSDSELLTLVEGINVLVGMDGQKRRMGLVLFSFFEIPKDVFNVFGEVNLCDQLLFHGVLLGIHLGTFFL